MSKPDGTTPPVPPSMTVSVSESSSDSSDVRPYTPQKKNKLSVSIVEDLTVQGNVLTRDEIERNQRQLKNSVSNVKIQNSEILKFKCQVLVLTQVLVKTYRARPLHDSHLKNNVSGEVVVNAPEYGDPCTTIEDCSDHRYNCLEDEFNTSRCLCNVFHKWLNDSVGCIQIVNTTDIMNETVHSEHDRADQAVSITPNIWDYCMSSGVVILPIRLGLRFCRYCSCPSRIVPAHMSSVLRPKTINR
ncbi:unnamed protein product [Brassicogethes aeneus]|uniref:Uncharacterized protein n=1 Tax=Brassicogethes aeneus TaxID=1431903 RepID=A0A9P0FFA2_BRAAE|nr:unnamed protein product [Brassicogethes aeneus]